MKKVTSNILAAAFALCILMLMTTFTGVAQDIKLIIRGDDMGMTQGSLAAFERAFNEGVLTCASVQAIAPWFEGAAELCRKNPGWCTGVHLALVAEWRGYRWRPVLPWDEVSSIVDEDGFLYTYPDELWAHKPELDEIEDELRAQVELAKKKRINVQYLDTHYMGYSDYPGLNEIIEGIAMDYDLPLSGRMGEQSLSIYSVPVAEKKDSAVKMLDDLEDGLHYWVCHPGICSPEQNALIHSSPADIFIDDGVGTHRAEVLNTLTSIEVKSVILKKGIKLTNYRELWEEQKNR